MSTKDQLLTLKDWLGLDLNSAYITGSTLTHIIESKFRTPIWIPADIDICCYNFSDDQYANFTDTLKTRSTRWNIVISNTGFENINYKIFDFYHLSTQRTSMSYKRRIQYADYSICSLCGDGEIIAMGDTTEYDIEHKILRWTGIGNNESPYLGHDMKRMLNRYYNYIGRGFIDQDNVIESNIKSFLKDNGAL
jgi:hypothetical protein